MRSFEYQAKGSKNSNRTPTLWSPGALGFLQHSSPASLSYRNSILVIFLACSFSSSARGISHSLLFSFDHSQAAMEGLTVGAWTHGYEQLGLICPEPRPQTSTRTKPKWYSICSVCATERSRLAFPHVVGSVSEMKQTTG